MTTTHHRPPAGGAGATPRAPVPGRPRGRRPGLPVLVAAAVVLAVVGVTLGPAEAVAGARRTVLAGVEALLAPWLDTVPRRPVEVLANVLLFVPVGALAAWVLRRSGPLLPLVLGAAASALLELAQITLPGRIPDVVDVAANAVGTALGVALVRVHLAARSRRAQRRPRRGLRVALGCVSVLVAGTTGCSAAPSDGSADAPAPGAPTPGGGAPTVADGLVPEGEQLSPFADVPAITGLDDELRTAVQDAARDAAADGVDLHVSSGWRSAAYQRWLFEAAVARYGSPEAARAYVLGPDESEHVTGRAVDIGPTDAMSWLAQHGADYGLCQTYANELWHFELAVERGGECPAPAPDASGA
ncbi:VanZ family protein [Blastococcus sp. SYSU DS1024]